MGSDRDDAPEESESNGLTWNPDWPSKSQLYRVALKACANDEATADDVAADAMSRAIQQPDKLARGPLPWFRRVIQNLAIDRRRYEGVRPDARAERSDLDLQIHPAASPEESLQRFELLSFVRESVMRLPDDLRDAVTQHHLDGLSIPAMSDATGVPESTLQKRCQRGLARLRTLIHEEEIRGIPALAILHGAATLVPATAPVDATPSEGVARGETVHGASLRGNAAPGFVSAKSVLLPAFAMIGVALVCLVVYGSGLVPLGAAAPSEPPDLSVAKLNPLRELGESTALGTRSPVVLPGRTEARDPVRKAADITTPSGSEEVEGKVDLDGDPPLDDLTAAPTREYRIQLLLDDQPGIGWTAIPAVLDPDAAELPGGQTGKSLDPEPPDEAGVFTFHLPEANGAWLFRLRSPIARQAGIWIIDEAREGQPLRVVNIDTASARIEGPPTLDPRFPDLVVLETNPSTGVWVLSLASKDPADPDRWWFPLTAAGEGRLRKLQRTWNPDHLPEFDPPWRCNCN